MKGKLGEKNSKQILSVDKREIEEKREKKSENPGRWKLRIRAVTRLLDKHVVSAESIGSFKKLLDESMDRDDRWVR